jgi:hypothetical protein
MCDYSLETTASRPAIVGDRLVTCRFKFYTGGFCAIDEPDVAVCLLPGTELAFEQKFEPASRIERLWIRLRYGKSMNTVGRFRKTNLETLAAHHDAVEFANGATVLVSSMRPGQRVRVLQLPVEVSEVPAVVRADRALVSALPNV